MELRHRNSSSCFGVVVACRLVHGFSMEPMSPQTMLRVGLCTLDDEGNIVSIWNFGEWGRVLNDIESPDVMQNSNAGILDVAEGLRVVADPSTDGDNRSTSRDVEVQPLEDMPSQEGSDGLVDELVGPENLQNSEGGGTPERVLRHVPFSSRLRDLFCTPIDVADFMTSLPRQSLNLQFCNVDSDEDLRVVEVPTTGWIDQMMPNNLEPLPDSVQDVISHILTHSACASVDGGVLSSNSLRWSWDRDWLEMEGIPPLEEPVVWRQELVGLPELERAETYSPRRSENVKYPACVHIQPLKHPIDVDEDFSRQWATCMEVAVTLLLVHAMCSRANLPDCVCTELIETILVIYGASVLGDCRSIASGEKVG